MATDPRKCNMLKIAWGRCNCCICNFVLQPRGITLPYLKSPRNPYNAWSQNFGTEVGSI